MFRELFAPPPLSHQEVIDAISVVAFLEQRILESQSLPLLHA